MARRTKSGADVSEQLRRIQALAEENSRRFTGGYGSPRYNAISNKAVSIAHRYQLNMWRDDVRRGVESDWNAQHSRRAYMGLSNG